MTGQFDEELISAFYDGELPDSERETVAHRIADDSEVREVLDDYSELSSSLKSLPLSHAPADLHGAVMRHVQDSSTVRPGTTTIRSAGRRLLYWTAGTAASLLLAVGLFALMTGPWDDSGVELAHTVSDAQTVGDNESAPGASAVMAAAESADNGAAESGFGGGGFSRMGSADDMPADEVQLTMDSPALQTQLQELLQQFDEVEAGQQLHVLQTMGDELVLIEFQVVDVDRAFGEVQVLLDELQITSLETEADVSRADALAGNRLRGILLDATHETLLAALDQIDELESVMLVDTNGVDMALQLGVDPDRIPPRMASGQSIAFAARSGESETPEADAAVPPAVASTQSRESVLQGERGQPDGAFADAERASAESFEYQVLLSISDAVVRELEEQQQQQYEQSDDARPSNEDPAGRDGQVPEDQPRADWYADRTRSRFLIIFVGQEDPGGD